MYAPAARKIQGGELGEGAYKIPPKNINKTKQKKRVDEKKRGRTKYREEKSSYSLRKKKIRNT